MSDETKETSEPDTAAAGAETESAAGVNDAADAPPKERLDEDGLPLDRDPTIDDVRSTEARHGRIAFGCTLIVVLLLVMFWLIRGGLIG
jgi:hypothetical protein